MQMRSDWEHTPQGIRARRTEPIGIEHFELSEVRRIDGLLVRVDPEQITVEFANPLDFALTGVRLELHYEGCYGKPGSTSLRSGPATLGPGEALRYEFPRVHILEDPGPAKPRRWAREHAAADLVVAIDGSGDLIGPRRGLGLTGPRRALGAGQAKVWADLTVSLAALGHTVECP